MRRAMVTRIAEPAYGIEVVDVPEPSPGPGQILVELKARPIQPADLLVVRDRHIVKPTLPAPVGIEGAGVVVAHGPGVSHPAIGTRVALPFGGTWSERVVISAGVVIPLPPDCDWLQAAMLALNPVTAWGLLDGLQAGQWLVHNAANSSLGQLITRIAAARGIPNISVVRRPGMEAMLQALGADHVLVDGEDLGERVKAHTDGRGAHRALDAVAGSATGRLHDSTAEGGELVCYGLLGSNEIVLPAARTIFRNVSVRGYSRLRKVMSMAPEARAAMQTELVEHFTAGLFHTPVRATFPLERVSEAVVLSEERGANGKVLLVSPELMQS